MLKFKEYKLYKPSRLKDPSSYLKLPLQTGFSKMTCSIFSWSIWHWLQLKPGYMTTLIYYGSSFLVTSCSSKSFPTSSVLFRFPVTDRKEGGIFGPKQILGQFPLWLLFTKQQNTVIFYAFISWSFLASLSSFSTESENFTQNY